MNRRTTAAILLIVGLVLLFWSAREGGRVLGVAGALLFVIATASFLLPQRRL